MSICLPINGVMNFTLLLCSTHLIGRISSRISKENANISFCALGYQMYFTYELSIKLTKRMIKLPSGGISPSALLQQHCIPTTQRAFTGGNRASRCC